MAKEKKEKETSENSNTALNKAIEDIQKQFGKGAIMRLDKDAPIEDIEVIPTGSYGLDKALGVGGVPRGRIIECFGAEASGKTTLSLQIIAEAQKIGNTCAFIDAEHAMDLTYAQKIGVNVNDLLLAQPDCGEDCLEIVETLVRSGSVGVIVVDSVAALVPRSEIEGNMGDAQMASQARLMSQALRKLTAITSKTNTIIIFINQTRQKIGVLFGDPTTTTGGNALKFYCSVRLDIRKIGQIKDGDSIIGNRVRVKVVKNKVAPPFQECEFDLLYGRGINRTGELIDIAVDSNIVEKSGAWYSYNGERLGQGRENSIQFLNEHIDIKNDLEDKLTIKI